MYIWCKQSRTKMSCCMNCCEPLCWQCLQECWHRQCAWAGGPLRQRAEWAEQIRINHLAVPSRGAATCGPFSGLMVPQRCTGGWIPGGPANAGSCKGHQRRVGRTESITASTGKYVCFIMIFVNFLSPVFSALVTCPFISHCWHQSVRLGAPSPVYSVSPLSWLRQSMTWQSLPAGRYRRFVLADA